MIGALIFFVPKFEPLLGGVKKPLPTELIFGMSKAVRSYWYLLLVGLAGVGGLVWSIDRFGGLLLGIVLGLTLAVALIGVADLLVAYRWPAFVPLNIKDTIDLGFRNAALVRWLNGESSGFVTFMGHWVPGLTLAREGQPQP